MEKDLLLVIDMQNVYAKGGEWCCPGTEAAAEKIKQLIAQANEKMDIVFTAFYAPQDPVGTWQDYNRDYAEINANDYNNEIMDILKAEAGHYPLYGKSTYSSLTIPELTEAVGKAKRVVITGVVAECCVLATAMAAIDAGAYVIYLTDAVAGFSKELEESVERILSMLEPLQVKRMTTEEYLSEADPA